MRLTPFFALIWLIGITHAQETSNPSPTFPIKQRAPENAQWTVNCELKNGEVSHEDGTKKSFITSYTITKTGPIYYEIATVKDGRSWNSWVFLIEGRQFGLISYDGSGQWQRLPEAGVVLEARDFSHSDFEELSWLNQNNYKGISEQDDVKYYLFETNTNNGPVTTWDKLHYDLAAAERAHLAGETYGTNHQVFCYLSVINQLPVKLDNGTEVRKYVFSEPPSGRQQPPTAVLQELTKWLAEIKALQR